MKSKLVILKCLTNLHVGNGDVNYDIIDNEVERDEVTQYPTIHSSGVKGALRSYLKKNDKLTDWFGAEGTAKPGKLKILSAQMVAMPLRASKGPKAYYLTTTDTMLMQYKQLQESLEFTDVCESGTEANLGQLEAEGFVTYESVQGFAGETLYKASDNDFRNVDLPVIARNCLDDGGISKNLWYEEVVSHESLFFFPVIVEDGDAGLLDAFLEAIDNQVIQFGGNASIGYGLCKVIVK